MWISEIQRIQCNKLLEFLYSEDENLLSFELNLKFQKLLIFYIIEIEDL